MDSTHSRRIDETRRREFEQAWLANTRPSTQPSIRDFLPEPSAHTFLATLEELVTIDLELRWRNREITTDDAGIPRPERGPGIEEYVQEFPILENPDVFWRLLKEEHSLRCEHGESPTADEYAERFAEFVDVASLQERLFESRDSTASVVAAGRKLGRYELLKLHARGGFGEVWRAYDPVLRREVALKVLTSRLAQQVDSRQRFGAEARTTARLEHPGVVSVHDLNTDNGRIPFYTMRLLGGETLAENIRKLHDKPEQDPQKPLLRVRLLSSFVTIARTVEYAHAQGIIHRDLKPQNIILGDFGETAILDWGLAKELGLETDGRDDASIAIPAAFPPRPVDHLQTLDGTVVGTPAYMSPEQAQGIIDEVDELSDQYCLGAILYELLTGHLPIPDKQPTKDSSAQPPRPRQVVPDVPHALEAICLQAMSPNRHQRYATVADLIGDLERYLADEPVTAWKEPWTASLARWVKHHRTVVMSAISTIAVAVLLLGIGFGVLVDRNQKLADRKREAEKLRGEAEDALEVATANRYGHYVSLAEGELLKNNVVRARRLLDACPVEKRHWEWHAVRSRLLQHLPSLAIAGGQNSLRCVAWNPSGKWVATGGLDGSVCIRDPLTLEVIDRLQAGERVFKIAVSPDGSRLAASATNAHLHQRDSGWLRIWKMNATGGCQLEHEERAHPYAALALGFSPDGDKLASGGTDGKLVVRDVATWQPLWDWHSRDDRGGQIRTIEYLPHNQAMSICAGDSRGHLTLFDLQTGDVVSDVADQNRRVSACRRNPQADALVTAATDGVIRLWQVRDGRIRERPSKLLPGHKDNITTLDISPNGKWIASGGLDRTVRLWNAKSGRELAVIRRHTSHVQDVAFSPDGTQLISVGDGTEIFQWQVQALVRENPEGSIVLFAPTVSLLATANRQELQIWDFASRELIAANSDHSAPIVAATFSHDSRYLASADRGSIVQVRETVHGDLIRNIEAESKGTFALAFVPETSHLAIAYASGSILVFDVESGERVSELPVAGAIRIVFNAAGDRLIVGHANGECSVHDYNIGKELVKFRAHQSELYDLALSPDERRLATAGSDGMIRTWDWETGQSMRQMEVGNRWINCVVYSPDGQRLICGGEDTMTFWDTAAGIEISSLTLAGCAHHLTFSSDGNTLASSGENPKIDVWQKKTD